MKKYGIKSIILSSTKKKVRQKSHILNDKRWHNYSWVFDGKKSILYVDGKVFKKKMPMTIEYWFKPSNKKQANLTDIFDKIRISKCARKIK